MQEKNFKSVINKVVKVPLTAMAFIAIITIVACVVTFVQVQRQIIESNLNFLKISQSQFNNFVHQIDHQYIEYLNMNDAHIHLKSFKEDARIDDYIWYISDAGKWMNTLASAYEEVQGCFCYYENIDQFVFRGSTNYILNQYIEQNVREKNCKFNKWEIVEINDKKYIINIKKYNTYYGGVWIPLDNIMNKYRNMKESYIGEVYLSDGFGNNDLEEDRTDVVISDEYSIYSVESEYGNISFNIAIKESKIFELVPPLIYVMFLLGVISVCIIPVVAMWLRMKISSPLRKIDDAMLMIGEGNLDYRIPISESKTYDEFDRLSLRINDTMDELNDMTYRLYESELKEQQTKLNYISQQIRPHFILNALNVIYTYEESEFPLVKKMVLYLTDYFRYIVNIRKDYVELEEEMHHVQNYLNIQKERYLDKFDSFVEWEVGIQDVLIPPVIIQTFVENCVKYGMRDDGLSFVYVLASEDNGKIKLMIADTGKGFTDDVMGKYRSFIETGIHQDCLGVGLENAIERMKLLYGDEVELKIRNAVSGGAVVEIYLPIRREL